MALFQTNQAKQFETFRQASAVTSTTPRGSLIGIIRIPRIGVSAVVIEGDDERTLRRAVGHIPGTAFPGGTGTVGLAGHRDTFFRGLGRVRENDLILLETLSGTHSYRAVDAMIVGPNDIEVLRPRQSPSLVLVTCYPFGFVGQAPQRYVIRATLLKAKELPTSDAVSRWTSYTGSG